MNQVQAENLPIAPRMALIDPDENYGGYSHALEKITNLVLMVLLPLLTAVAVYTLLPLSFSAVLLPIATTMSLIVSTTLFGAQISPLKEVPFDLVFPNAPVGIENRVVDRIANNCWINALGQVLRCDNRVVKWFGETPNFLSEDLMPSLLLSVEQLSLPVDGPLPEFLDLPEDARHIAIQCAAHIRNLPIDEREKVLKYLKVIQEIALPEDRLEHVKLMLKLGEFFDFYQKADHTDNRIIDFSTQTLRLRLGRVNNEIEPLLFRQEDAAVALTTILDLLPPDLKVSDEERRIYDTRNLSPILDLPDGIGRMVMTNPGFIPLPILGIYPKLQDLIRLNSSRSGVGNDPTRKTGVDGVEHLYPVARIENQFVDAPESLWIQLKRFNNQGDRISTRVQLPDTLKITTKNNGLTEYQLDGFVVQRGTTLKGGHYVSYKRELDANNEEVWYEMNDEVVTKIDGEALKTAKEMAYIPHYSRKA